MTVKAAGSKTREACHSCGDDQMARMQPVEYPTVRSLTGTAKPRDPSRSWDEILDIARSESLAAKMQRSR